MAAIDRVAERSTGRALGLTIAVIALAMAGVGVWLALSDSPPGGAPVVIVPIPPEMTETPTAPAITMRQTVAPDGRDTITTTAPDTYGGDTVTIIHPNSGPERDLSGPVRLTRAPVADLIEHSEFGPLPRIGSNGQRPSRVYARPSEPAAGGAAPARIAIVVGGLGLSASGTSNAIKSLPGPITFAFAPYGTDLQTWVDRSRGEGHEVMLQTPMEPFDFPDNDPGPHTLLTSLTPAENLSRLRWVMARFSGYTGILNHMGAKFTASIASLEPIVAEVSKRGLAYLDDGSSPRSEAPALSAIAAVPHQRGHVEIDTGRSQASIEQALRRLEKIAQDEGQAIGVASALPVTIETLADWAGSLESRNIELVPVSALLADGPS